MWTRYALAFFVTFALEAVVMILLCPRGLKLRRIPDVLFVNLITHPIGTVLVADFGWPWPLVETGVLVTEATLYRFVSGFTKSRAVLVAVAANAATALLSFL